MSGLESALADSDFARSIARELTVERLPLGTLVDMLAGQRQHIPFLGSWLASLPEVPFGRVLGGASSLGCAGPAETTSIILVSDQVSDGMASGLVSQRQVFSVALAQRESEREEELVNLAAAGFDGACCALGDADRSAIQYLTELGRELRISPIWMIESEAELGLVLETDAPYFGFVVSEGSHVEAFPFRPCDARALRGRLPKSSRSLCFFESPESDVRSFMFRLAQVGFDAYIDLKSG